jgi:hypothetical protein
MPIEPSMRVEAPLSLQFYFSVVPGTHLAKSLLKHKETELTHKDSTTEPTEAPVEKKERKRNGSPLPSLARELQKMTEASTATLAEFAKEEGEKLTRKAAEVENAATVAAARERDDHAKVRAVLNTITGGAVERFVRVSTDEDSKAFLRDKGWRV